MSLLRKSIQCPGFDRARLAVALGLLTAVLSGVWLSRAPIQPVQAASSGIVISQVYGGGGNTGATYKNDFIELFNRGASPVNVNGWSVQYASATGTTWQVTNLTNVSIQPGQYYLVQEAQGAGGTTNLPTPDATGTIAMAATAGKVALVNNTTALSGACPTGASIIDFAGFGATANCFEGTGPTPAPSNTTAVLRGANGCTETDQNTSDFAAGAPNPRNTATALSACGGLTISINNVTLAEGNGGPTTFGFVVSLSSPAPAGGVTFDIATQDNTATVADNDYVLKSLAGQTIPQGSQTYNFDVTVNGDTTPEPNETFFVNVTNVSGAAPASVQGTGTINNDDVTLTPIHTIQGSGNTSPLSGSVTTTGIVTGLRSNGFFIQEPDATVDADPNTSEGIFVFTSSTPPAAAAIGNSVQVTGTVQEFIPSADPYSPSVTEIAGSPTVNLLSTGNPLPASHTITGAETLVNDLNNLEKYEGMRVHVDSLTAISGTQGTVNEPNATSTTNGIFYGVITGVARPFREPGIEVPDPIPTPTPNPNNIPRFDFNPERLRVDSDAQPGTTALEVSSGEVITNITGPLDYGFRTYTILPDAATPPTAPGAGNAVPVPTPTFRELTIGTFNMERFFNTTNDGTGEPVLTATAFNNRLNKASLTIRNFMRTPDVIGIEEMESLTTLQSVATKVNNDAIAATQANPNYQPFLVEGNDVGGIDVGLLVKGTVNVVDVTQINKNETYINPNNGQPELLNDRPPLVLRATIVQPDSSTLAFTVIVVHQRSLSGVDDPTDGNRVRTKRRAQAESLANYIQSRETADPSENIVVVGDFNAFQVNDGYVDVMGTVKGTPTPPDQVLLASSDLVNPDLTDLGDLTAGSYSYSFDGDAQSLDHALVNTTMFGRFSRLAPVHIDADFPESYRNDPNRPERISDHDPEVAFFTMAQIPTAANGSIFGSITAPDGSFVSGALVTLSGSQLRKTITDARGKYHFDNVETNGFYTVTPSRANYVFSPANRSFSPVGSKTEAVFSASSTGDTANPLDVTEYFVRQQYVDLLGREPDAGGFNYWSDQINQCGSDSGCVSAKRRDVAAAFFIEQEFQQTGLFIYDMYASALVRKPALAEYSSDRAQVVGGATLEAEKTSFAQSFVQRAEFAQKYQAETSADSFVDALIQNLQTSGVDLSSARPSLIDAYKGAGSTVASRASVMLAIADDATYKQAQYNAAFVLTEYFAYLRRDLDQVGYDFWLNVLNSGDSGNYRGMVCSFITSTEYQRRFSAVVSHSNGECGR